MPLKVIGTDGGLLPAALSKSYVMLMPGERVDVWADFGTLAGKQVILKSLSFDPGGMMGGGMMGGGGGMGGRRYGWRRHGWRRDDGLISCKWSCLQHPDRECRPESERQACAGSAACHHTAI